MTRNFILWWIAVLVQSALVAIAATYNYFGYVFENDLTQLSFLILAVWIVTSVYIGYKTLHKDDYDEHIFNTQWFTAESCMTLGMIGTVIGFLIMLGDAFASLDLENIASMRNTITNMAVGMSTALITTLNGLIASLFLKIQIIISENM